MGATVNRSSALFGVTPSIAQPRLTSDAPPGAHPWVCVWVVHSGTIPLKCPVRAQLSWLLARPTQLLGELGCTRLLHTYRPASSRAALDEIACAECGVLSVNWLTIHIACAECGVLGVNWLTIHHSPFRISSPTLKGTSYHQPFQISQLAISARMLVSLHACQLSRLSAFHHSMQVYVSLPFSDLASW
jgi:hypothetical protein